MTDHKKAPIQKNDLIDVQFEDLTHEGAGVAKIEGFPVFVPYGLPGEKATIKVTKVNKGYGFGRLMKLIEKSEDRIEPSCSIYKRCGGCQLQHLSYEGQLKAKEKMVREVLGRIGKLNDVPVHPVLGMSDPWHYRNKAQVPVGEMEGGLVSGFYAKRTHEIVQMDECLIQMGENDQMIETVRNICEKNGVPAYDEKAHRGVLRHIMVRRGQVTGQAMVVLVTRTDELPHKKEIVDEIVKAVPGITSVIQNVNAMKTNVILGSKTMVLWGDEVIYDYIGDIQFAISPRSFYQVNPEQTKVLYDKTLEYAGLTGEEVVMDAYCGIGTISLFLAQNAKKVYGVEIVPEAIEDARNNAKLNGIENVEFEVGAAEAVIPDWYKKGIKADVLVVDPPRKGCDETLLNTIQAMKPKKVVYVSCNPATLARDLRYLEDYGYQTIEVQPVDMFPQTMHCEAVAKIILKEGN